MKTFAIVAMLMAVSLIFVAESQAGGFGFAQRQVFIQAAPHCQSSFVPISRFQQQSNFRVQRQVFIPSRSVQRQVFVPQVPIYERRVQRQVFVPQNQTVIFNFDD